MKLYMIRHGESAANRNGTHSGWSCVSLTETGRQQALAARKNLCGVEFDKLFVSDVLRVQQTAELLFPGMPRTFLPIARELNNTPMQGKTPAELSEAYGALYQRCREAFDYGDLGIDCETLGHLFARAADFLKRMEKCEGLENVCVVSHGGFITTLAAFVLGLRHYPRTLICDNASLSIFEFQNGKWRIRLWNQTPDEEQEGK